MTRQPRPAWKGRRHLLKDKDGRQHITRAKSAKDAKRLGEAWLSSEVVACEVLEG